MKWSFSSSEWITPGKIWASSFAYSGVLTARAVIFPSSFRVLRMSQHISDKRHVTGRRLSREERALSVKFLLNPYSLAMPCDPSSPVALLKDCHHEILSGSQKLHSQFCNRLDYWSCFPNVFGKSVPNNVLSAAI